MLAELHIEDLGVVERLDLVLHDGLTVFTGETGAGKTMLVEAVQLLLGGRADPTRVRSGATEARVEGRFEHDGEELVLSRVVPIEGRSRSYVNGRLVTVAGLAEIGAGLVELHGQHEHQRLLSAAVQRRSLDAAAGVELDPLRAARGRLTEIDAALASLGGDERARAREIDLLRFQVAELDAAAIVDADEDHRLEQAEDLLADAAAHRGAAQAAAMLLAEDDGAGDRLGQALTQLSGRGALSGAAERLHALAAELHDAASELRAAAEAIEEDPVRLESVRQRRQLLRDLCRKYGEGLDEVLAFHADSRRRLAELESYEERARALEGERAEAAAGERREARIVAEARRRGAPALAAAIEAHLQELAMPHARVEVAVGGDDPADEVSFRLAANPGSPMLALARAASGGELARAMLALRLVLTEAPHTLVFDEVDAGIGGAAALAVGRSLTRLGSRHQVLVVTHLAQVAAGADHQVVVTKHESEDSTTSTAAAVDGPARLGELARMLSGHGESETARRHAEELVTMLRSDESGRRPPG